MGGGKNWNLKKKPLKLEKKKLYTLAICFLKTIKSMFVADERNQTATIDWIHEALIKSREWEDRTKETRRIKQHNPSRLKKCSGA